MSTRAWLLFGAVCLLWGMPYLFIKIAVAEVSPPVLVLARVAIGAAVLLPIAARSGMLRGLAARWRDVLVLALLEIVVPFLLITAGEQSISSSLTSLLIASEPLFIAVLALWVDRAELPDRRRALGLVVGFVGVVLLFGGGVVADASTLPGAAMVLAASLCYAGGVLYLNKRLGGVAPLGSAAVALGTAAVLLLVPAALSLPPRLPSPGALGSLAVLGLASTAAGFICFFSLIAAVGPSRAAVITYVSPLVATILGVVVLGERLTPAVLAGTVLILVGSWSATRRAAA